MLFELTNALTIFQKLINHVLYDHLNEFVIAYLNDILIFSKMKEKHEQYVKKMSFLDVKIIKIFSEKINSIFLIIA